MREQRRKTFGIVIDHLDMQIALGIALRRQRVKLFALGLCNRFVQIFPHAVARNDRFCYGHLKSPPDLINDCRYYNTG